MEEGSMCPACIESTALMVAGVASGGGILALYIGKFRKAFRTIGLDLFQKKGKMTWQRAEKRKISR
jgi:hypothetical protein